MTDQPSPNDLNDLNDLEDAQDLLKRMYDEVRAASSAGSGVLSGGTELSVSEDALDALRTSRVTFGNPTNNLVRLTSELFAQVGVELNDIRKQQMQTQFDFYYMTLAVTLQPERGAQFVRLECALDFGPKGAAEPIVQAMFPPSAWKEVLSTGGGLSLGLNGNLDLSAGVDTPATVAGVALPGQVQADVANKNSLKALIVVPDYAFKLGRSEIAATGEGDSKCFWRIENPELQQAQTVQLGIVFKVPKQTSTIELSGLVTADPNINWLVANLRDVIDGLSDRWKRLLQLGPNERSGAQRLPIGAHEAWHLTLPS